MANTKHLLPQTEQYFKTNLHTHSVLSDGILTPQEVKDAYKAKGYQILCLTDHNIIANHSEMNEPDFLMLTGAEINLNNSNYRYGIDGQTFHFNLIAKRPDNLWIPNAPNHRYPGGVPYEKFMQWEGMDDSYNPAAANAMIAKANEMGFLVMYNHPTWSCQSYPDYAPLKGLWGMELRNGACHKIGNNEDNARVFKDLMNLGNRLFPVGADDAHRREHMGLAWIMLGAEKLEYGSVIDALEKGDFYMSCGPEIHSLSIEGNILKITCSDAQNIALESYGRFARRAIAQDGAWLQSAEFDLTILFEKTDRDASKYIHLTVTAPDGTYAATRAYFLNELI